MSIRALIVDDEFLARRKLKTLLEPFDDIQLVGEAKNGKEALELIKLKEPDLIFLDIEMPGLSGIDVINHLEGINKIPYIVFSTAYDEYAVKAFETEAMDYLLKPYEAKRLKIALNRVRKQISLNQASALNNNIFQLLSHAHSSPTAYLQFFDIKKNGRTFQVPVDEVTFFQSEGNYVELVTSTSKYLYRTTMNTLEAELSPDDFLRIHRSAIVNIHFIQSCIYQNNAVYKFRLKNNQVLLSGRVYRDRIVEYLNKK